MKLKAACEKCGSTATLEPFRENIRDGIITTLCHRCVQQRRTLPTKQQKAILANPKENAIMVGIQ